jgi:methylated-DNA-[protein]-cysteine S-methyltransferase
MRGFAAIDRLPKERALVTGSLKTKLILSLPFGPVAVVWGLVGEAPKVVRVLLSTPEVSAPERVARLYPHGEMSSCAAIDGIATAMEAFLAGDDVQFSLEAAQMSICSAFQQAVLRAEHQIPRGWLSTYLLIARHLGQEHGARAVGNALAHNPFPIIIPCHRAIRSDRSLGGFQGGLDMKRALLLREGIFFDEAGRVVAPRFFYDRKSKP